MRHGSTLASNSKPASWKAPQILASTIVCLNVHYVLNRKTAVPSLSSNGNRYGSCRLRRLLSS
jgi:hypothetical protein